MAEAQTTDPPVPGATLGTAPLLQQLRDLWHELPGLVSDRVELLSLELQRATQSLVEIAVLLVAVAVLGVTAWLLLWAVLISVMVGLGLQLPWALVLTIAINGIVIVLALQRVRGLLPLSATRRRLMAAPRPTSSPENPSDAPAVPGSQGARLRVSHWPAVLHSPPWAWNELAVLHVDAGYDEALIGSPSRDSLWLWSRRPQLAADRQQALVQIARDRGFAVERLRFSGGS